MFLFRTHVLRVGSALIRNSQFVTEQCSQVKNATLNNVIHFRTIYLQSLHKGLYKNAFSVTRDTESKPMQGKVMSTATRYPKSRYFFLVLPIICFGLGTWQVKRLQWKANLIEDRKRKLQAAPSDLPSHLTDADINEDMQFRKIKCEGEFGKAELFLVRQHKGQPGYHIISPFATTSGDIILVDRGWVPSDKKDPATRSRLPQGKVKIQGLLRIANKKSVFLPDNDVEHNFWTWLDLPTMARQVGATVPLMLEYSAEGNENKDFPIPSPSNTDLPNDHLSYVITWYSLSVALSAMAWKIIRHPKG